MKTIKLGISISLTGSYAVQGVESFRGLTLRAAQVNAGGGIYVSGLGRKLPVEVVSLDDGSDAGRCRENIVQLLTRDEVDVLLGPYSSSLALAAADVAEERGVTLWNHGGSTDEMEGRGFTCLVSAITPASAYSRGILRLVRETDPRATRIASFYAVDSGFSRNVARGVDKYAAEDGFHSARFGFVSGAEDFSSLLDDALACEPDLIIGMGRMADDMKLAKRIIERKPVIKAVALVAASINYFKETFGESAEGFISSSQWERGIDVKPDAGPMPEEFYSAYKSAYGSEPDYVSAQGYNICVILEECIRRAGTLDDAALRETARSSAFNTFYGRFETDSLGNQTGHEMVTVQWQVGGKVIVHPESKSTGRLVYPARFNF